MESGIYDVFRMTILHVDDELDARRALGRLLFLKYAGHRIISASGSIEALQRIEEHNPDLFLLDLHLPFLDGYGLLAEIVARRQDAKIIVISGCTDPETQARCSRAGASVYLPKPVIFSRLCAVIDTLIKELLCQRLQSLPQVNPCYPSHSLIRRQTNTPAGANGRR